MQHTKHRSDLKLTPHFFLEPSFLKINRQNDCRNQYGKKNQQKKPNFFCKNMQYFPKIMLYSLSNDQKDAESISEKVQEIKKNKEKKKLRRKK